MATAYVLTELRRSFRNPRYLIFTVLMPVVLFLVIGVNFTDKVAGVSGTTWYMVNMAVFGATGALLGIGARIAVEREAGWNRQLRLTPLPPMGYVVAKVVTAMLVALTSIVLVCAAGLLTGHVDLDAKQWASVTLLSWIAMLPLAVVGVGLGYLARADSVQAVQGGLILLLSMFGGLWFPVDQAPQWLQTIAHAMPTYWIGMIGRAPLTHDWPTAGGWIVLAVWAAVGARVAARRYHADELRAA
jgi:ABC-2 type transport system permease protein